MRMSEKENIPETNHIEPNDPIESAGGAENTARSAQQSPQTISEDQTQEVTEASEELNSSDIAILQKTDSNEDLLNEAEEEDITDTDSLTNQNSQRELPSPLTGISSAQFNQLTKRSKQFMIDIDKSLTLAEMNPQAKTLVYTEMVETLISGQQSGQTARQLYGTPTETANIILEQEIRVQEEANQSPDWQIALDGGLMLGSIFTLITGVAAYLGSREGAQPAFLMGIVTLIVNYLAAGYSMLRTAKVLPDPDAPKGEKGYGKYFLVSTLTMILWVAAVMLTQILLPSAINPLLPPIAYIIIAVLTFGARYLVKRQYNIKGGLF